jgi:hypothetical protein
VMLTVRLGTGCTAELSRHRFHAYTSAKARVPESLGLTCQSLNSDLELDIRSPRTQRRHFLNEEIFKHEIDSLKMLKSTHKPSGPPHSVAALPQGWTEHKAPTGQLFPLLLFMDLSSISL